jgi:hypothetical protein
MVREPEFYGDSNQTNKNEERDHRKDLHRWPQRSAPSAKKLSPPLAKSSPTERT